MFKFDFIVITIVEHHPTNFWNGIPRLVLWQIRGVRVDETRSSRRFFVDIAAKFISFFRFVKTNYVRSYKFAKIKLLVLIIWHVEFDF